MKGVGGNLADGFACGYDQLGRGSERSYWTPGLLVFGGEWGLGDGDGGAGGDSRAGVP